MKKNDMGKILRNRRKLLRIGQKDLARLARLSVHTVSDIEMGRGNPTLDTISILADVLGMQITLSVPNTEE